MFTYILFLFVLATLSQGGALYYAGRHQGADFASRKKWWLIHYIFNGILWLVLLAMIIWLQFSAQRNQAGQYMEFFGAILTIAGLALSWKSMIVLGLENAMGKRFFFPENSSEIHVSTYRILNNPMYDGFLLVFLGLGFQLGISENFQLALASLLLLNVGLASIENYRISWNIF